MHPEQLVCGEHPVIPVNGKLPLAHLSSWFKVHAFAYLLVLDRVQVFFVFLPCCIAGYMCCSCHSCSRSHSICCSLQHVCGFERDSMDTVVGYDARVIQCLQDYRWAPTLPACL